MGNFQEVVIDWGEADVDWEQAVVTTTVRVVVAGVPPVREFVSSESAKGLDVVVGETTTAVAGDANVVVVVGEPIPSGLDVAVSEPIPVVVGDQSVDELDIVVGEPIPVIVGGESVNEADVVAGEPIPGEVVVSGVVPFGVEDEPTNRDPEVARLVDRKVAVDASVSTVTALEIVTVVRVVEVKRAKETQPTVPTCSRAVEFKLPCPPLIAT